MRDKAVVISVNGDDIVVVPMITDACLSCSVTGCAKRGKPFTVSNKKNLAVSPGSIVKIGATPAKQAAQGIISLALPVLCAAGGYAGAPAIAAQFGHTVTEGLRAAIVLSALALSALIVFLISRSNIHLSKSEITEII